MSAQAAAAGSSRRNTQDGVPTSGGRRAAREWQAFDSWFRGVYGLSGHRPRKAMIVGWYEQHAPLVWGAAERPSLQEARDRAKGLGRALLIEAREAGAARRHRYPLRSHRSGGAGGRRSAGLADSGGRTSSDGDGDGAGSDSGPQPEEPRAPRTRRSGPPTPAAHAPPAAHAAGGASVTQRPPTVAPSPLAAEQPAVAPSPAPAAPPAAGRAPQSLAAAAAAAAAAATAAVAATAAAAAAAARQQAALQHFEPQHLQRLQQLLAEHQGASGSSPGGGTPASAAAGGTPLSAAARQRSGACSEEWCEWEEEPIGMDIFMSHMN